ncbi:MAG TPA: nucleoside phosphorylase [Bacteroidales bacterium]|nr:nucleoside phosphorylase [Bacteroidales bacterium]HRZ77790.1 nucleoside phosphorylase [Bacteroidales bacterium]
MRKSLKESELVLNTDGSIYHLHLHPGQLASNVVLVGDPQRVALLSSQFERIDHAVQNREFVTHTGLFRGVPVSVVGTGIGTDNIDIVVNELDAVVNIDLSTRRIREERTSLRLLRLGTTGLLQPDVAVGTPVASVWGLGLDALLRFYRPGPGILDEELGRLAVECTGGRLAAGEPYAVKASAGLLEAIGGDMLQGITLTAPGFYAPQGRMLRLEAADPGLSHRLAGLVHQGHRVLNFEMETSALYGLGRMLGHEVLTVCLAVANRANGKFMADYHAEMRALGTRVLERLCALGAG